MTILIVGLGNPGSAYRYTNHNVGSDTLQFMWSILRHNNPIKTYQDNLHYIQLINQNTKANCLFYWCPDVMNICGRNVKNIVNKYKIKNIILLVDELDLPPNKCKLHRGAGSNGHKGVKNIKEYLGQLPIKSIRIGIGRPENQTVSDYVLSKNPILNYKIISAQVIHYLSSIIFNI